MKAATMVGTRSVVWDYVELTKPRLNMFVLIVVAIAGYLAAGGAPDPIVLLNAISGAALVGGGASALNMFIERDRDARMLRTQMRPLVTGRISARDGLIFGVALTTLGLAQLWIGTTPLAALCGFVTLVAYVGVYTPLKPRTTLNTHIGAIPGALPALIGWAAVTNSLETPAWAIFWIVYLWQIPHFLAIAWIYRDDYKRGGFKMLPSVDPDGITTGRQAVAGALALIPISLLPAVTHGTGLFYVGAALALGAAFLWKSVCFLRERTQASARSLMRASLIYLPILLFCLVADSGLL